MYIKKYYDLRIHFSRLTFSFFIIFILNYAIFNLQLFAKMFRTYLAMMKLGTVIPYLMKIQKNTSITGNSPCILLTLAFFQQKLANFAILRNADIDT